MATLLLPLAGFRVTHSQGMAASDPDQGGAFHRRYRDSRSARTWTLPLRRGRAARIWSEMQFRAGASGSAQWDFLPPREDAVVKVRFTSLAWTLDGGGEATVVEDLSSDTSAA